MSLLDRGRVNVTVFLEETSVDVDGNIRTRPSTTGIPASVVLQPKNQSGTSARRSEQDNEGYEGEKVYSMRFPRSWPHILGAQSQIEWNGARWALFGDAVYYGDSPNTAHIVYTIKRY